jgi:hypothetical protein
VLNGKNAVSEPHTMWYLLSPLDFKGLIIYQWPITLIVKEFCCSVISVFLCRTHCHFVIDSQETVHTVNTDMWNSTRASFSASFNEISLHSAEITEENQGKSQSGQLVSMPDLNTLDLHRVTLLSDVTGTVLFLG